MTVLYTNLMKLHYFQHVPFEGPGSIGHWATSRGHDLTTTRWHLQEQLPQPADVDLLVVMGGPMSIHDENIYPWLSIEKEYIRKVIGKNKTVLGICLGAQLIADVLGGKVSGNKYSEIGWHPVFRSKHLSNQNICQVIPAEMEVFHWHGETFSLPRGCELIASSEACVNQGFIYGDRIIGLQFHLELTIESATGLIDNCRGDLQAGEYIQRPEQMLSEPEKFLKANKVMNAILEYLENIIK